MFFSYTDADGDSILCTSPEEFGQAVASMTDDVLRLNVTPQSEFSICKLCQQTGNLVV